MGAFESTPASALKVGDTIQVWWGAKRATVSGFRPHNSGQVGWTVADFTDGLSMTVTPEMVFVNAQKNMRVSVDTP